MTRMEPSLGARVRTIVPLLVPLREPVVFQRRALLGGRPVLPSAVPNLGRFVLYHLA
jgi:hypothetical protein